MVFRTLRRWARDPDAHCAVCFGCGLIFSNAAVTTATIEWRRPFRPWETFRGGHRASFEKLCPACVTALRTGGRIEVRKWGKLVRVVWEAAPGRWTARAKRGIFLHGYGLPLDEQLKPEREEA